MDKLHSASYPQLSLSQNLHNMLSDLLSPSTSTAITIKVDEPSLLCPTNISGPVEYHNLDTARVRTVLLFLLTFGILGRT